MDLLKQFASIFKTVAPARNGVFGFFSAQAMPKMGEKEQLKAFRGWVYACTNAISQRMADTEIYLQQKDKNGEWQNVKNGDKTPAMSLLHDVNSFWSLGELIYATQAYQELCGNTFWWMVKDGRNKLVEIWPLNPTRVEIVKSEEDFIDGYVYTNERGVKVPFDADEIIQFKRFNPNNPYRGLGTVEAAALAIDTDQYAGEWQRNFFGNAAMPSGVLSTDGTLNQSQYDRIRENWESKFKGVVNAHKLAILEGNLKFQAISPTSKEMDYTNSRKALRDEICGIFGVPLPILGILDTANLASADAADLLFARNTLKPKIKVFVGKLTEFYLPLFGYDQENYRIWFKDPVPENLQEQRADRESGIKNYYMTPNEARAEVGLEPVEGGDYLYIPSLYAPLTASAVVEAEAMPDDQGNNNDQNNTDTPENDQVTPPSKGYRLLPLKSKVIAKKKAKKQAEFYTKAVAERSKIVAAAIPVAKKKNLELNEQLKSLLLKNLQNSKNAPPHETKGLIARLKDITDPKNQMVNMIFDNFAGWVGLLHDATEEGMTKVFEQSGRVGIAQVNADVSFNLKNPRAVQTIQDHIDESVNSYGDTMKADVSQVILTSIDAGETIDQLSGSLGQFFDDQSDFRAERLARTETIDAYAQGNLEGYKQSGVVTGKSWLADGGADDSICVDNASQGVIPIDDDFESGDDAPPGHPNCECALQPEVGDTEDEN